MNKNQRWNRRQIIQGALGGAMAAPAIVPPAAFGRSSAPPPSERITMGVVGLGPRGQYDLGHFLKEEDVRVVAVSDCFADRREAGKKIVDEFYANSDCASYRFHEEMLERKDIDAVLVATGDRWHAVMSVLASRAGKDVYCEKPFSLTIGEGRALVEEMKRNKTVWQCGTQRRSIPGYQFIIDLIREGRIGKLHTMTLSAGTGGGWRRDGIANPEPAPKPEVFDYDRWMGQAPLEPYSAHRVKCWRINWATGAGSLADMGAHYAEFARWAHDAQAGCVIEFDGWGVFRPQPNFNNTPHYYNVSALHPDGVRIVFDPGVKGCRFDGDEGYVAMTDYGEVTAERPAILDGRKPPVGIWKLMRPHIRNFLDCVKTRKQTISHPESAHRAHSLVHCANLCLRLGRKLRWDSDSEWFVGDEKANEYVSREMREPWDIG